MCCLHCIWLTVLGASAEARILCADAPSEASGASFSLWCPASGDSQLITPTFASMQPLQEQAVMARSAGQPGWSRSINAVHQGSLSLLRADTDTETTPLASAGVSGRELKLPTGVTPKVIESSHLSGKPQPGILAEQARSTAFHQNVKGAVGKVLEGGGGQKRSDRQCRSRHELRDRKQSKISQTRGPLVAELALKHLA